MKTRYTRRINERIKEDVNILKYLLNRKIEFPYLSKKYFDKIRIEKELKKGKTIDCLIETYNYSLEETIKFDKLNLFNKIRSLLK